VSSRSTNAGRRLPGESRPPFASKEFAKTAEVTPSLRKNALRRAASASQSVSVGNDVVAVLARRLWHHPRTLTMMC
jgi:hypothetical protein